MIPVETPPAVVAPAPGAPAVSGVFFTEVGRAGFDVTRAFVSVQTPLGEVARVRLTLDGGRYPGNTGPLGPVMRHAYVEGPVGPVTWRAGLVFTPWLIYESQLWQHRLQGPLLVARQGWVAPTDFGVAASGHIGPLSFDVGAFNGEGFLKSERDYRPAWAGRLTWAVGGGWELAGFAQGATAAGGAQIVSVAHRTDAGAVLGELIHRDAGEWAASAHAWRTVWGDRARGLDLMGRLDWVPDPAGHHPRTISGVGYRFDAHFRVLVDYEQEPGAPLWLAQTAYVF